MEKKLARIRRARRARSKIRELGFNRLSVHRTPRHIYAQILSPDGGEVLASASTLQPAVREGIEKTGNIAAAQAVGRAIA
ncbi:MAG: 50S ribosomal protein L18, partial [Gammaproteobacteria bacterium]